jgi:hypothetical protein
MKYAHISRVIYALILLVTPGSTIAGNLCSVQEAATSAKPVTLTSEERSFVETAVLADKRVRQIVGEEKPRILISAPDTDKTEAQAFIEGTSEKPPSHRVTATVFNPKTNKAARVLIMFEDRRVLEVQEIKPDDVPFSREDAEEALALAKASPEVRRALGDRLEQFNLLDSSNEARSRFAAQALPLRSTNPRDPCSANRCLDLVFRTEEGYLSVRAHVDLTKRTVTLESRRQREKGEHP